MKNKNHQVSTVVTKLDMDFILDNFLNTKLWGKKWTIFEYDNNTITLELSSIDIISQEVSVKIKLITNAFPKNSWQNEDYNHVSFSYKREHRNLQAIDNKVFGTVIRLIESIEARVIRHTESYKLAERQNKEQRDMLSIFANNFLNEQGVTHRAIREAYVDQYVSENAIDRTYDVLKLYRHTKFIKNYLMVSLFFGKEASYNEFKKVARLNGFKVGSLRQEMRKLIDSLETDEYEEEMKTKLEEV